MTRRPPAHAPRSDARRRRPARARPLGRGRRRRGGCRRRAGRCLAALTAAPRPATMPQALVVRFHAQDVVLGRALRSRLRDAEAAIEARGTDADGPCALRRSHGGAPPCFGHGSALSFFRPRPSGSRRPSIHGVQDGTVSACRLPSPASAPMNIRPITTSSVAAAAALQAGGAGDQVAALRRHRAATGARPMPRPTGSSCRPRGAPRPRATAGETPEVETARVALRAGGGLSAERLHTPSRAGPHGPLRPARRAWTAWPRRRRRPRSAI